MFESSVYNRGPLTSDFDAIKIGLASPEKIRSWSCGEVTKPETINYRTFKPERNGLFCCAIFGPVTDWECLCGKYKRMKHRGVICEKCGTEVTLSRVRRERLGHIELAAPCSHVWYFKVLPSHIGQLLDITMRDLERILYYEAYIVVDTEDPEQVKQGDVLSEEQKRHLDDELELTALMGAEGIKELLKNINIVQLADELRNKMKNETSVQKRLKHARRLKVVEAFRKSGNKAEWMILDVVPVIPPELRPLVPLDGGRFATSDLNDLYRRVINRNNRLKKLIDLRAPDVIVRNEKRMLQEAVDALFDNGRRGHQLRGANNRPLKSLADTLKGKYGRFRQNLLGKRVDYSGRSVIVVGPELKLHQCGLPKKMALELFKPFIYQRLEQRGHCTTVKQARELVEQQDTVVWDILEDVIQDHPVLLNRAPTLHRLGIQAFEPVLVEGKAIKIHPLVCTAFNADFDGDQMAVHIPLSPEAQVEAHVLMLSANNILSPANGSPIATPSQDMVLGVYYLTKGRAGALGEGRIFSSAQEVLLAYDIGEVETQTSIKLYYSGPVIDLTMSSDTQSIRQTEPVFYSKQHLETTVGRVVLNERLPREMPFINGLLKKQGLSQLVSFCYLKLGREKTVVMLDDLKELGFLYATLSGMSIGIDDMIVPEQKEQLVSGAQKEVMKVEQQYLDGAITHGERYNKIIEIWSKLTDNVSDKMFADMKSADGSGQSVNPIYVMADSGARGSEPQIRQLSGMRGLMAKPSGEIIETPITANFREGLNVLQYFISTHGARKGLADTALKTADSGYLTRRLVDVAQDVIITENDCCTNDSIDVEAIVESGENPGTAARSHRRPGRGGGDQGLRGRHRRRVQPGDYGRSGCSRRDGGHRTCQDPLGAHLRDRARRVPIVLRPEPRDRSAGREGRGRRNHCRPVDWRAWDAVDDAHVPRRRHGHTRFRGVQTSRQVRRLREVYRRQRCRGQVGQPRGDEPQRHHRRLGQQGQERERYQVMYGAKLRVSDGQELARSQVLIEWDPFTFSILTESEGHCHFHDLQEGLTLQEQVDEVSGMSQWVVADSPDEKKEPRIEIRDEEGNVLRKYLIPTHAHLMVRDGDPIHAGDVLAKIPRETTKTKDITGGLPRVVELFEARRPGETAVISEIDGVVEYGALSKGHRKISVIADDEERKDYNIPRGVHISVQEGERVRAGEPLMDGPRDPHDILRVLGEKELQRYLVNEIQAVYRVQGVGINDKHLEVIVRQMMRWVNIEAVGDSEFLVDEVVDKFRFVRTNQSIQEGGDLPASGRPLLMGITKASLSTDSFVSAASFQLTTRVLTEASVSGKVDHLCGLKENVIVGRLIPAGTGLDIHQRVKIAGEDEPEEMVPEVEYLTGIPSYSKDAVLEFGKELADGFGLETPAETARPRK